ncbi:hypothetical protein [Caulobacter segnis]|uniref:hypothetical protein n=1 Tax=Caulobacter segnis TaxID=88688 RepID=UPI001CBFBFEB|nr:hypothetical protein [Caulobacter segnis]UAL12305.1 hypothetical protein K8940_08505 [Caulobacter segnis]
MPLPRKPRLKRSTSGTRASRRYVRDKDRLKVMIMARFIALHDQIERRKQYTYRGAYGAISYFKPGEPIPPGYQKVECDEDGNETPPYVKEKAPGLTAEGFSSLFKEKEAFSG